jgi:hypothetical protein
MSSVSSQTFSQLTAVILLPDASGGATGRQVNYIAAHLWSYFVSAYGAPPTAHCPPPWTWANRKKSRLRLMWLSINPLIYAHELI